MDSNELINRLFDEAHDLPEGEREGFLRSACGDEGVIRRVLELFASAASAPEELRRAVVPGGEDPPPRIPGFRVVRRLAEGGMGVVYEAEEDELQSRRKVALKVIRPELMLSGEARERFRREAATAARLDHPAIVPIYRYSEREGPQYIAMKFIDGVTFDVLCREMEGRVARGELSEGERQLRIAREVQRVAEALHHAHGLGVVHRDVKPTNILTDREGRAYLGDFGIAKAADEPALTAVTRNPLTVDYASPEQVQRDRALERSREAEGLIDGRSDVFSLGVVLYEALTGKHPFRRPNPAQTGEAICTFEPPSIRQRSRWVPKDLAKIVRIAIEKDRRFRYPTAAHLATDLDRWRTREPIYGRGIGPVRRLRRWAHRNRGRALVLGFAAATVLALVLLGALAAQHRARTSAVRVEAGEPIGAAASGPLELRVAGVDPVTLELGPFRRVGRLPATVRLEPGAYRLEATSGAGGPFAEGSAVVLRGGEPTRRIELRTREVTEVAPEDMVLIGGAEFEFGVEGRQGLARRRTVRVDDFLLDRAEVSNAEYDRFVRATGHRAPGFWREWSEANPGTTDNFDPAWADLPVVDVSWRDAEAYARWRGKRLATVFEWERAMGDAGRRAQPWGDGPAPEPPAAACEDTQRAAQTDRAQQLRLYLRHVRPVRSAPGLVSPEGLFHGASNVQEIVESVSIEPVAVRLIKGVGWAQLPQVWTVREVWTLPFETVVNGRRVEATSMIGGFRCARSVRPASLNAGRPEGD